MGAKARDLNYRTNIYYIETVDAGRTWRTVNGESIKTPFTEAKSPALVRDYRAEDLSVYLAHSRINLKNDLI